MKGPRNILPRFARRWTPAACPTSMTTAWCAGSITTPERRSSSSRTIWGHRMPCSAVAATTGSPRPSAALRRRASGSPWEKTGWCWRFRHRASSTAELAATYIAPLGERTGPAALALAKELRASGLRVELGDGSFRLKKSFEAANKLAHTIVILGEDEVASGILTLKHFASGEQFKVPRDQLSQKLAALLAPPPTSTSN